MLKIQGLSKEYIGKKKVTVALKDVNLEIQGGEFLAILGLSGSGKTTLVSHIGGLDVAEEGAIFYKEINTNNFDEQGWSNYRLNNIGFVFQDFYLIKHLNAIENIELAMSLSGKSKEDKHKRALDLLDSVGLLECIHQYPNELSGGQKQRVAIARALANKPNIILADEPTGALDPKSSKQIMNLLQELAAQGHTVILVTHDDRLADEYATRIVEIDEGVIIKDSEKSPAYSKELDTSEKEISSLQFGQAFKLALNNLKIRKKSTVFSLVSLIPGIIIILFLMNFLFNLIDYKAELDPLINDVTGHEQVFFIAPFEDNILDETVRDAYRDIKRKSFDAEELNGFKNGLMTPYNNDVINEIKDIDHIQDVVSTSHFGVSIEDKSFVIITLPPKDYARYQSYLSVKDYPEDDEKGLVMYSSAARKLYGQYSDDYKSQVGENVTMNIWSRNALRVTAEVLNSTGNEMNLNINRIIELDPLTTFMDKYYEGYIFVSYGYGSELEQLFDKDSFGMIATSVIGSPIGPAIEVGPMYMDDQLLPLRNKTFLQETFDLFHIKEYSSVMPSNNYSVRTMVITDQTITEADISKLSNYGVVSDSRFDKDSIESVEESERLIQYGMYIAAGAAGIMILIPSLLICLILYISILIRTNEIGIIKAIGGRRIDIVLIFLLEAVIVAVVSAVVANIIFIPILQWSQGLLEETYRISFELGSNPIGFNLLGLIVGNVIALLIVSLMSLLPGLRASKLPPNMLLKHVS